MLEVSVGGFMGFPASVYIIEIENGLHAANNATLPDGATVNGLACFPEISDATCYMELPTKRGLSGSIVKVAFDRARELAKDKLKLNSLLLFRSGKIVDYHFVE